MLVNIPYMDPMGIVWDMAGMSGALSSAVGNAFHECCLLRVPKGLDGHSGHGHG